MQLIKNKVAVVTGAAAGIGAGIAQLFAEQGAHVYILDIDGNRAGRLSAALEGEGLSAYPVEVDVRNKRMLGDAVENVISRFGRVDILINNAGVYPRQDFLHMTEDQWDSMQAVNLKSIFTMTKLVLPHMVDNRSGAIVNISSVTFFLGMKNLSHYISTKGAIIGFTRALAREMGEQNVRVNCISPGAVETEGERALGTLTEEQTRDILAKQSLQRRIVPLDIARVCLFLCSDLAGAMTGQTLNVDGGWVMY